MRRLQTQTTVKTDILVNFIEGVFGSVAVIVHGQKGEPMSDQRLIDANALKSKAFGKRGGLVHTADIDVMPTIEPDRKKMSNKEWVDFLSEQFTVSRTSAREMLHGLMRWKAEDNFKKQFNGGKNEKE